MKRFAIAFLLLLSLLFTSFPLPVMAAEQALPRSEGEAPSAQPSLASDDKTVYDALYVGADGSTTANGGRLIGLYTAFGADDSVSLSEGKWKNKMKSDGLSDALLRDTAGEVDFVRGEDGGVGYRMTAAQWKASCTKIGITLPEEWEGLSAFTVEHAAVVYPVENDKTLASLYSAVHLGLLKGLFLPADGTSTSNERFCMRWSVGRVQPYFGTTFTDAQEFNFRNAYGAEAGQGLVTSYTKYNTSGTVGYEISYSNGSSYKSNTVYTLAEYEEEMQTATNGVTPVFSLFNGMPVNVYAIRVYDAPLTEAEKKQNAMVDMMAYAGLSPTEYMALDGTKKAVLHENMTVFSFDTNVERVKTAFNDVLSALASTADVRESLYVSDGLTLLSAAYAGYHTGSVASDSGVKWFNAMDPSQSIFLKGEGWERQENGFYIEKDLDAFRADKTFGMYLPTSALPEAEYTVEAVYTPMGLTQKNEQGETVRYIDDVTVNGTYVDTSIAIGPLRALQFVCYRPFGLNGQMERRYCYAVEGGWLDHQDMNQAESGWAHLDMYETVTYAVTHALYEGGPRYTVYNDFSAVYHYRADAEARIMPDEAGGLFQLMVGMAGTAYAVRVYDRVLTENERARNRAVDIAYYYGFDTHILQTLIDIGREELFAPFADMDFLLSAEEAKDAFEKRLSLALLQYDGVGVRKGDGDCIRHYFTLSDTVIAMMKESGYSVEAGVLVNVGRDSAPLLCEGGFDYKLSMYGADGKNTPFFVSEDTFAVTVAYENLDKDLTISHVFVRAYVILTDGEGNETVLYQDTRSEDYSPDNLFLIYNRMLEKEEVKRDTALFARMETALAACYDTITVHVRADAAGGGDGSAEAPFASFSEGFFKCKEYLSKANVPTRVTLLLGDGEYAVYEPVTLTGADMPHDFSYFHITSETGNAVLTTTRDIETEDFAACGENLWVYSFEKTEGTYPAFRYLYADGKKQELAYEGGLFSFSEDPVVTAFDRTHDGPWQRAKALFEAGTLSSDSVADYPEEREDLHAAFAYYRDRFLAEGKKVKAEGYEAGKMYLPLSLVESLRADVDKADKTVADWFKTALSDMHVEIHAQGEWWYNILPLAGIDFDDIAVDEADGVHVACYPDADMYRNDYVYREDYTTAGRYVRLKNALCFAESEGEYYYDESEGRLYYYSEGSLAGKRFAYGTSDGMLRLKGVKNVTLSSLTITGVDDYYLTENTACLGLGSLETETGRAMHRSALFIDSCDGLTIRDCRFRELGAGAIAGDGVMKNIRIEGNTFENLGAYAVHLGGDAARRRWDSEAWCIEDLIVTDNYIHNVATEYHNASALWFHYAKDSQITYNTVDTCTYTAISVGFNFDIPRWTAGQDYHVYNVEIAYNNITNFMHGMGDGGAIYSPGGNSMLEDTRLFNSVHHNYVCMSKITGDGLGHMVVGIYFDGATTNWHCYENVIAEQSYGAVAGEADDLFEGGDPYTVALRNRYRRSSFIYLQHVAEAQSYHILCEANYILNVRASTPAERLTEVYKFYLSDDRDLKEKNTKYEQGVIPSDAAAGIIRAAGCTGYKGDPTLLRDNDY